VNSFSKSSRDYRDSNTIQKLVADEVLRRSPTKGDRVIDLGAGDGEIFRQLDWNLNIFSAIDISEEMLNLHPQDNRVSKFVGSFDSQDSWNYIENQKPNLLLSSSSFQWSNNIERLFRRVKKLNIPFSIAIFTSKTFNELHNYFDIESPIYSKDKLISYSKIFDKNIDLDIQSYQLEFNSSRELLKHIKNSGVSGNLNRVSPKILKEFIREEPLKKLSFEVLYINSKVIEI